MFQHAVNNDRIFSQVEVRYHLSRALWLYWCASAESKNEVTCSLARAFLVQYIVVKLSPWY